jgi:hypothetical protein
VTTWARFDARGTIRSKQCVKSSPADVKRPLTGYLRRPRLRKSESRGSFARHHTVNAMADPINESAYFHREILCLL